jgi:plastocyanin
MRHRLNLTRAWLYLLPAITLLAGCPQEKNAAQRGSSTTSDRQTASETRSAPDQNDGQRLGYVPAKPAQTDNRTGAATSGQEAAVGMTDTLKYAPEEVTITVGQSVVWTNTSSMVHTVTADPTLAKDPSHVRLPEGAKPFDSGNLTPGATFRHTFDVPGEYVYFCIPHEAAGMVGRVNVREKQ